MVAEVQKKCADPTMGATVVVIKRLSWISRVFQGDRPFFFLPI